MTISFENRVAIVTGAGNGLGKAYALELARRGAKVVVNDLGGARDGSGGSEGAAQAVAAQIEADGGEAIANSCSVTDEEGIAAMVEEAKERWGRIDVLINNAGILKDKSFAKMSIDEFRAVVEVHLIGSAICTKAVWETMREQNYGRIVLTSSASGIYGNFGQANYGAAKMALVGLMQTLAIEGEKYDIRVNCLAPTAATQMTAGVLSDEGLRHLDPAKVSPGLLALVGEAAPTRSILCAGAGHFACANVTLTEGRLIGDAADAGEQLVAHWDAVSDRTGEIIPAYGFTQAERELASAGTKVDVLAVH
ncbi:MAG TPA: SDR family NAD(P)-dependent oxidoreductase [Allosphingosinicella sp.]|nr:SDR family NAD(P)-dependent oxidoreductase [Allosphingosinicella sp.]